MTSETIAGSEQKGQRRQQLEAKLEAMSWGAFFVWVGATILFEVELGIGLLGVAIIVLGTQAIRWAQGLRLERFWIGVGICFLVGGVWEQFDITLPLVPILLIGLGIVVFLTGGRAGHHRTA